MIRAAYAFQLQGLGVAVLVGREELIAENMAWRASIPTRSSWRSSTPASRSTMPEFVDFLYERLQRRGYLRRDVPAADQSGPQFLRRRHGGAAATPTAWSPA